MKGFLSPSLFIYLFVVFIVYAQHICLVFIMASIIFRRLDKCKVEQNANLTKKINEQRARKNILNRCAKHLFVRKREGEKKCVSSVNGTIC